MQHLTKLLSIAAVVLLIGAGCAAEDSDVPAKTAEMGDSSPVAAEMQDSGDSMADSANMNSDIRLEAEAQGNGQVAFTWEVADSVEKTDKYRLIRSEEMNPEFDGKNYWLQIHHTKSEYSWIGLPTGTMHFRLCTFEKASNSCTGYSNNVMVEVN